MLAEENIKMTLEEFNQLEETSDQIYELINGALMMTPRPSRAHQQIQTLLSAELVFYFKDKSCNVIAEAEIQLGNDVLVPDIFIYCDATKFTPQRYIGAPVIVIEIISPSTAFNDYNRKYALYKKYGVKEYWIVDPNGDLITVHSFVNNTIKTYKKGDKLVSDVFDDMEIELDSVFTN